MSSKPRWLPATDSHCEIRYIEGANHTFCQVAWKREAIDRVSAWIRNEFPAGTRLHDGR